MSDAVINNFRGLRALVLHIEDGNRAKLTATLEKLGLNVTAVAPADISAELQRDFDLVLFDADDGIGSVFGGPGAPDMPCIALIGSEAPGRLNRVVGQRAASHILKPIRSAGVFTALFLAVNEFHRRQRMQREIEALRQRLKGRRLVTKAVLRLVGLCGIDEDEAYEWLRAEAMNRRIPIEDMARESLGMERHAQKALHHARISRDR